MVREPFRWGIISPGRIARKFAASLPFSEKGSLHAVYSREKAKAEIFGAEFGNAKAFDDINEFLKAGQIDAAYISSPHPFHFEQTLNCLSHGVPVLCEKPMTVSRNLTSTLIERSQRENCFLMEGMWTVFLPHFQKMLQLVKEGEIGDLIHIQADFGYKADFNPENRQFNPDLGGGAVLDIGIYPLALVCKLLGQIESIQCTGTRANTGVDDHVIFQGLGTTGVTFQSIVTFRTDTQVKATIWGSKGKIKMDAQWLRPVGITLECDNKTFRFHPEIQAFGFQFEANEVANCVQNGTLMSPIWSHEDSLEVAYWMDYLMANIPGRRNELI
jgi:predicted dehydrogenase